MARLARMEVFAPDEIAIVHVMNRVVRRCFLLGTDPVTGKNFDHRKEWIEQQLQRLAACFGIDLLAFSILSNHFHLILRSHLPGPPFCVSKLLLCKSIVWIFGLPVSEIPYTQLALQPMFQTIS